MSAQFVCLELPPPISTNELFVAVGRRRVKSKRYEAWLIDAGLQINAQRPRPVEGPYALTIRVPSKWRGDLDNAAKAISDVLQVHGVIVNDKLAQRILLEKWDQDFTQAMVVSTREQSE